MSARLYINGALEGVAKAIYPNIKYQFGTPDQIAQVQDLRPDQPIYSLYTNYRLTKPQIESSFQRTQDFGFFIGLPDQFDSMSQQSDNILSTTDIMADQYLNSLGNIFEAVAIEIANINKTPQYKMGSDTVSGTWVQCEIIVNDCNPNTYPDLSEFLGSIGRDVSPYDWRGILKNANSRIYK